MERYDFRKIERKWQRKWLQEKVYEPFFAQGNRSNTRRTRVKKARPFYNLMMFPYPSAEGLHVGNMYAFTGSDIYGRFKRMQGYDVFEPIGLDGFGIHSENYALKIGAHPMKQARVSEKRFYKQLQMIGNGFAWDERLETYDPEYYRWTQWLFVQMFKHGLAYRKKQAVNWCSSCKTVLADEQVLQKSEIRNPNFETNVQAKIIIHESRSFGVCERCETPIVKKDLAQWFFKITAYAERLLKNLDILPGRQAGIDWSERVKIAQKNWIGRSEGALIKFEIRAVGIVGNERRFTQAKRSNKRSDKKNRVFIEVFTTRPDTLFGATYLVLSPEHSFFREKGQGIKESIMNYSEVRRYIAQAQRKKEEERITQGHDKTGVELKGLKAINPATKEEIPVWVADYVLGSYGTGAIMAVPAHDERDYDFASRYKLPVREVVAPQNLLISELNRSTADKIMRTSGAAGTLEVKARTTAAIHGGAYTGNGILVNSGKFSGMDSEKAKWIITKFVGGKRTVRYRLRDWLISRQRYWGPPIPIIYCRKCWELGRKGDRGKKKVLQREGIDYAVFDGKEYIIYPVPETDLPLKLPFMKNFRPTGTGKSPLASLKSFYETKCPKCDGKARRETDVSDTFLDSSWYYLAYLLAAGNWKLKIGNSSFSRLARKWCPVNMYIGGAEHSVLHLLYARFVAMALHDMGYVHFEEPFTKFRAHGLLIRSGAKMSKSKGNIVNPDECITRFGTDALRMHLMFSGPFEEGGDFRDAGIAGITRFLERVWRLGQSQISSLKSQKSVARIKSPKPETQPIERLLHRTIKKVSEDIENLRYNTAISALMMLFNEFEKAEKLRTSDLEQFLKLLAPFAPHITEELWQLTKSAKLKARSPVLRSIHREPWPSYNPTLIKEDTLTLVIQVNGKVRASVKVPEGFGEQEARDIALAHDRVRHHLRGKEPRRVIYVPGRLINFVV